MVTKKQTKKKEEEKEGRGRKSRNDLPSEGGRYIMRDLIHFDKTGFNPYSTKDLESPEFWRSRKIFQEVSHGAFIPQAKHMATVVKAQMPQAKKEEAMKAAGLLSDEDAVTIGKKLGTKRSPKKKVKILPIATTAKKSLKRTETRKSSLRDTYVCPLAGNKAILVMFEAEGNVLDPSSTRLEFKDCGTKILRLSKVPSEWTDPKKLIGKATTKVHTDGDCMILSHEIEKRQDGRTRDEDGVLWEPWEVIELPFPCHKVLFNKHGDPIESFLHQNNQFFYSWCWFWLQSKEVPYKGEKTEPSRITGALEEAEDKSDDESIAPGGLEIAFDEEEPVMELDSGDESEDFGSRKRVKEHPQDGSNLLPVGDRASAPTGLVPSPFKSLPEQDKNSVSKARSDEPPPRVSLAMVAEIHHKAEIKTLRYELEMEKLRLENAMNDLKEATANQKGLERKLELQSKLRSEAEKSRGDCDEALTKLQETLMNTESNYICKLEVAKSEKEKIEQSLALCKAQHEEEHRRNVELQFKMDQMLAAASEKEQAMKHAMSERLATLENDGRSAYAELLKKFESEIEKKLQAEKKLQELSAEIRKLQASKVEMEARSCAQAGSESMLAAAQTELKLLKEQLQKLHATETENQNLRQAFADCKSRLGVAQVRIEEKASDMAEMQKLSEMKIAKLHERIAMNENLLRRWEERNKADFQSVAHIRILLEMQDKYRKSLETKYSNAKKELEETKKNLHLSSTQGQLQLPSTSLEEELRSAKTEIESLRNKLELCPTEDELEREVALRTKATDRIQTLESDIEQGMQTVFQLRLRIQQLEMQQNNAASESATNSDALRRVRETNAELEEQLRTIEEADGQPARKRRRQSERLVRRNAAKQEKSSSPTETPNALAAIKE